MQSAYLAFRCGIAVDPEPQDARAIGDDQARGKRDAPDEVACGGEGDLEAAIEDGAPESPKQPQGGCHRPPEEDQSD